MLFAHYIFVQVKMLNKQVEYLGLELGEAEDDYYKLSVII